MNGWDWPSVIQKGEGMGMAVNFAELGIQERKLTRRGLQRRSELMRGAMLLFSEFGYEGTTTKAVAERVGVTEAVIFRYFHSKQQLFRAVVEEYRGALRYSMPYEGLRDMPFSSAVRALVKGYLDNSWVNRRIMRLFLLATFHDEQIQRQLGALFEERRSRLEEMLSERVVLGELQPGCEKRVAEVICLAVTGFLIRALRKEPVSFTTERDAFLDNLVETVANGAVAR